MGKREAIVPRDRVLSFERPQPFPPVLSFALSRIVSFLSQPSLSTAIRSFLRGFFFFIFLPLHFAATGFHGQLISSRPFVRISF